MSDIMRPLKFRELMDWAREEYAREGKIFGLSKEQFFYGKGEGRLTAFGDRLATAVGPAAGPNSQLSQNILVSYLAGARFIELKTVQKMDGEEIRKAVAKPCILAEDEAYNCEWSTELTVEEAYDEYLRAWFAIRFFARELAISDGNDFAFNMSVGYDLDGIKLPKIDRYIEEMKDASGTEVYQECLTWLREEMPGFERFNEADLAALPSCVSHSITLSTLHGCPPQEIERIAEYLLKEKKLDTFIKCNPTLLGYETARGILDRLGYGYISFDDLHFREDMQYDACVAMIRRLAPLAASLNLAFGLKLTNTFPVDVKRGELPSQEMYMSGRSLHALTLHLAARLSREFDGRLPLSFSGGADAWNIESLLELGVGPVTMATTLLKPGGYARFKQIAERSVQAQKDWSGIDVEGLEALLRRSIDDPRYHKLYREKVASRKTASELPLFDCYKAPCQDGGCPIGQQIPEYLKLTAEGRMLDAIRVICLDNSAPSITGRLCPQPCREHCTRLDYEESLSMREMKRAAAEQAQDEWTDAIRASELRGKARVLVIGAGPAGMAAALFLRRNGLSVMVRDKADRAYGLVSQVIPSFRISEEEIERDFQLALREGVEFEFNADPAIDLQQLRGEFSYVVLATGAWGAGQPPVNEGEEYLLDSLSFLFEARRRGKSALHGRVAVVGGGDVAMDCARLLKREEAVEQVDILYRRSIDYMPAAQEDVRAVQAEGIDILEFLQPIRYDGKKLLAEKTRFGEWGQDGRRSVEGSGEMVELSYDAVIGATGARLDEKFYAGLGLAVDGRGRARLNDAYESSEDGVYVVGDGRIGPSTIVRAIADAKQAARDILRREGLEADFDGKAARERSLALDAASEARLHAQRGRLEAATKSLEEGRRCLSCDLLCEVCTEVCPNRANLAVALAGKKNPRQIVHMDRLCNECGNCAVFCPHAGKPYKDKLTLFSTAEDFTGSEQAGWLKLDNGNWLRRSAQAVVEELDFAALPIDEQRLIEALPMQK